MDKPIPTCPSIFMAGDTKKISSNDDMFWLSPNSMTDLTSCQVHKALPLVLPERVMMFSRAKRIHRRIYEPSVKLIFEFPICLKTQMDVMLYWAEIYAREYDNLPDHVITHMENSLLTDG